MTRSVFGGIVMAALALGLMPGDISAQSSLPKKTTAATAPQAAPAGPLWTQLTQPQQQALGPLVSHWDSLSASHKRKWIALSRNYGDMPLAERALLHARMDDWIALSPQQRRAARLNFAETKRMSGDEKQQKWQAYQALTPDARHKLGEVAPAPPSGAAIAVRPVSRQKLANVPVIDPNTQGFRPKLTAPNQIDPHTLLPQRRVAPAPTLPSGDRPNR